MSTRNTLREALYTALETEVFEDGTSFKQIMGGLRNNHGFCCLGVACEVARLKGLVDFSWYEYEAESLIEELESYGSSHAQEGLTPEFYTIVPGFEQSILPLSIRKLYGFESYNPIIGKSDFAGHKAISMNDSGISFVDIAAHFRKIYPSDE